MKTGVILCCLLAGIVLCIGTASGTGVTLSDCDKSVIIKTHNDIRSDVSPTAANMVKLVSHATHMSHTHTHTHTHTHNHPLTHTHMQEWSEVLAKIAQTHAKKCTYRL